MERVTEIKPNRGGVNPLVILALLVIGYLVFAMFMGVVKPFAGVASNSMEPFMSRGDLVFVKSVAPADVQVGDIVVFEVPEVQQIKHSYPASVIHRVTDVEYEGSTIHYQTKGDNSSPDPFTITQGEIRSRYAFHIPSAGFLLLYFGSSQGLLFIGFAILAVLIYMYGGTLLGQGRKAVLGAASQSPEPEVTPGRESVTVQGSVVDNGRLERMETEVTETREALGDFSLAIGEYATHLKSHTAAVQGMSDGAEDLSVIVRDLADGSQSLVQAVQSQNEILIQMKDFLQAQAEPRNGNGASAALPEANGNGHTTNTLALKSETNGNGHADNGTDLDADHDHVASLIKTLIEQSSENAEDEAWKLEAIKTLETIIKAR